MVLILYIVYETLKCTLNHNSWYEKYFVYSAYFSPLAGDKLLTTDQHSQLR